MQQVYISRGEFGNQSMESICIMYTRILDNRLGVAEFLLYGDRVISLTFANVHKIALRKQGLEDKKFDLLF